MPSSEEALYKEIIILAKKYMAERGIVYGVNKQNVITKREYRVVRPSNQINKCFN